MFVGFNIFSSRCWTWESNENYFQVQSTFSSRSWEEHHETWKEHRYEWLPSWQDIPKHLHEALSTPHLSKLKVSQQNWWSWWIWRLVLGMQMSIYEELEACLPTRLLRSWSERGHHWLRPPNACDAHPRPIVACNLDTRRGYGISIEAKFDFGKDSQKFFDRGFWPCFNLKLNLKNYISL